jgi:hypothetical protein
MSRYGVCLENGEGVETDLASAARYFKMSADIGNSDGMSNYGWFLANGQGLEQDLASAVRRSNGQVLNSLCGEADGLEKLDGSSLSGFGKFPRDVKRVGGSHGVHSLSLFPENCLERVNIIYTQIRMGATLMTGFPKLAESRAPQACLQCVFAQSVPYRVVSYEIVERVYYLPEVPVAPLCREIVALYLGKVPWESYLLNI